jgi:hypothetical protein
MPTTSPAAVVERAAFVVIYNGRNAHTIPTQTTWEKRKTMSPAMTR